MSLCLSCNESVPTNAAICPHCKALQRVRAPSMGPGTQIERGYARIVVDRKLGAGAMGNVWRAWLFHSPDGPRRSEPPELIALKQLRHEVSLHKDIRELFLNEAEALSRLSHPNVVRFLDLFEWTPPPAQLHTGPMPTVRYGEGAPAASTRGMLTLAMEFVDGATLEDVIARNVARQKLASPTSMSPVPGAALAAPGLVPRRALVYFEQLLGALAGAHALGILHRDVKPSNLVIRKDGVVKLTDFGIAHLTTPRAGAAAPSDENLAPGTGAYMSPEQVLGEPLDGRSDLYSAAIVFYEMLAGRPPFVPSEKSELMLRMDQVETKPPPIATLIAGAPPLLQLFFDRALAKDRSHRFATAIELGTAAAQALGFPTSVGWKAQEEMAALAPGRGASPGRMNTVRGMVEHSYKTGAAPSVPLAR